MGDPYNGMKISKALFTLPDGNSYEVGFIKAHLKGMENTLGRWEVYAGKLKNNKQH